MNLISPFGKEFQSFGKEMDGSLSERAKRENGM